LGPPIGKLLAALVPGARQAATLWRKSAKARSSKIIRESGFQVCLRRPPNKEWPVLQTLRKLASVHGFAIGLVLFILPAAVVAADAPGNKRVEAGKWQRPPRGVTSILLAREPDGKSWKRIDASNAAIFTADRLMSLPGATSTLALKSDVQ